jgi:hypothetical protein
MTNPCWNHARYGGRRYVWQRSVRLVLRALVLSGATCVLVGASAAQVPQVPANGNRSQASFRGRVVAGQRYQRAFGPDFLITLTPESRDVRGRFYGWDISVFRIGDAEDLLQLVEVVASADH